MVIRGHICNTHAATAYSITSDKNALKLYVPLYPIVQFIFPCSKYSQSVRLYIARK